MPHVIAQPCAGVKNAACVEVCPVDYIHTSDEADQFFIDPETCIDCGVCLEVCPVQAIFFRDALPDAWAGYREANASFFRTRGPASPTAAG